MAAFAANLAVIASRGRGEAAFRPGADIQEPKSFK
jgi:hypothetical protein